MCGIFGYISNDINKININAFKILGILNENRGTQSCGVHVDAEILHGVSAQDKLFRDFLIGTDLQPKEKPVLFGHTRKASSGVINIDNAHPFGFGTNSTNDGYAFIGVHNGTIHNDEELAKEFGVETKRITGNTSSLKIDSELLLESLYVSRNYKPLSKYNGGAALAWYTPDDDCFYLFSGESKDYTHSTTTSIERPLHVWIIDDNTFAFSSEKEPLMVIGASKEEVFQIKTNTVYQIKNGDFKGAVEYSISRATNTNKRTYAATPNRLPAQTEYPGLRRTNSNDSSKTTKTTDEKSEKITYTSEDGQIITVYKPKQPIPLVVSRNRTVLTNTTASTFFTDINLLKGRVYVDDLVYKRNGHPLATGTYLYIKGHGLHYVSDTVDGFHDYLDKHKRSWFDIVDCKIVENISAEDSNSDRFVAISSLFQKPYCIYRGYLLDTVVDYNTIVNNETLVYHNSRLNYEALSHVTRHPVKNLTYHSQGTNNTYYRYIKDGELVEDLIFGGPCFDCIYHIKKGTFVKQEEFVKNHLKGLDLLYELTYNNELEKYNSLKKKSEEQDKKKNTLVFKQDIKTLLNKLRQFGKGLDTICPTLFPDEESRVMDITYEMLDIYEDYEENSFMTRTEIDVYGLSQDLLDVISKKCPDDDDEILELIIVKLKEISKGFNSKRYLATGLLKQITN